MVRDEAFVPGDHGGGLHDQHHVVESRPPERGGKDREDRPVDLGELRSVDLALQHKDLMAESEDFCVAPVTGRDEPSETPDDQVAECVRESHSRPTVSAVRTRRNPLKLGAEEFPARIGKHDRALARLGLRYLPTSALVDRLADGQGGLEPVVVTPMRQAPVMPKANLEEWLRA